MLIEDYFRYKKENIKRHEYLISDKRGKISSGDFVSIGYPTKEPFAFGEITDIYITKDKIPTMTLDSNIFASVLIGNKLELIPVWMLKKVEPKLEVK